jgi:hypothetical protein
VRRGDPHRRGDIVRVTREGDGERLERVQARVRGEQMPRVGVRSYLARELALERCRQAQAVTMDVTLVVPSRSSNRRISLRRLTKL